VLTSLLLLSVVLITSSVFGFSYWRLAGLLLVLAPLDFALEGVQVAQAEPEDITEEREPTGDQR